MLSRNRQLGQTKAIDCNNSVIVVGMNVWHWGQASPAICRWGKVDTFACAIGCCVLVGILLIFAVSIFFAFYVITGYIILLYQEAS